MAPRAFARLLRPAFKTAVAVLLVGLAVFYGLTRTDRGRDALRVQIERQFEARFQGRLSIGRLEGDLLRNLSATDVRLYDPQGRLAARVDSVELDPRWAPFTRQQIALSHVRLVRPHVYAVRGPDGRWNVATALRGRALPDDVPSPWRLAATRVEVHRGRLTTRNVGAAPPAVTDGRVFDYTNTEVRDVEAQLSIDWQPADAVVDVMYVSGALTKPDFEVRDASGQFVVDERGVALNQFALATAASDVRLQAEAFTPAGDDGDATHYAVTLDESRLGFDEWSRLFPRLPLRDTARVSLRARGPAADLVVESLTLARGQTRLAGSGQIRGLPREAHFDVAFHDNRIDGRDVRVLVPDWDADLRQLGPLDVTLTAAGVLAMGDEPARPPTTVQGRLDVRGAAGAIDGNYQIAGRWGSRIDYHADATARDLDVARILARSEVDSHLDGHVRFSGTWQPQAHSPTSLTAQVDGARYGNLQMGAGQLTIDYDGTRARGDLRLDQPDGFLTAHGVYQRAEAGAVTGRIEMRAFDVSGLTGADSLRTRLTGLVDIDGRGRSFGQLTGDLRASFDSSAVGLGDRLEPVDPFTLTASLSHASDGRRSLTVGGDVFEAQIEARGPARAFEHTGSRWPRALARTARTIIDKPYGKDSTSTQTYAEAAASPDTSGVERPNDADEAVTIGGTFRVLRPTVLPQLIPTLPEAHVPMAGRLDVRATADSLNISGNLDADTLAFRTLRLYRPRTDFTLTASSPDEHSAVRLVADVSADSAQVENQRFPEPHLRFDVAGRQGTMSLHTADGDGPVQMTADLDFLRDRNRVYLTDLRLSAQGTSWQQPAPQQVDLYSDAIVVPHLILESDEGSAGVQRLTIEGVASAAPGDTLHLGARGITLNAPSNLTDARRRIGGELGGHLAYTGGLSKPELTGSINIDGLTYDDRLLGTLSVSAHYLAGTPDVGLQAKLEPAPDTVNTHAGRALRVEPSRLTVDGTFRFPTLQQRRIVDPGKLALNVDAEAVDAFFFDYIFKNDVSAASGTITGQIDVGGNFHHPVFEAELNLADGYFEIPKYGLAFSASGPARADDAGLHLQGLQVTDPTGGGATLHGSLLFNDYRYFSLDLHGALDEIQVMNVQSAHDMAFYGSIWASGDLHLTGPLDDALLRSSNARTTPESEIYIPIEEGDAVSDVGFILFADSTGRLPDIDRLTQRTSLLERPEGERKFTQGLNMDLNIEAPSGSTVHLVIDPLVGEAINAVGSGRVQLVRREGEFFTYGTLNVEGGEYLFSAGELLFRRFQLDSGGTIVWDGNPIDPRLDLTAYYRTRASTAGLPEHVASSGLSLIPVLVRLHVTERVTTPQVGLELVVDRADRDRYGSYEGLEAYLNQLDRAAEFATSVLLTNSFLLTTSLADEGGGQHLADTRNQLAFSSLSQLVASQLNHYLSQAIPNFDVMLGLQGQSAQDLGVTYGVALRLLDERLIIRGEGIYHNEQTARTHQGLEGEFIVEVRLNHSVSVEVFYRREGDVLESTLTNTTGAGLSYQTDFTTWGALLHRFFGWLLPRGTEEEAQPPGEDAVASNE